MSGYNFQENIVFLFEDLFILTISVDPDEMQHYIWVFTVCKSTYLGVSHIQRVNPISDRVPSMNTIFNIINTRCVRNSLKIIIISSFETV